jgi:hypothetical protein
MNRGSVLPLWLYIKSDLSEINHRPSKFDQYFVIKKVIVRSLSKI